MPAHSALDKLSAAVPSIHQLRAQHARGRLLFDTKPWFRSLDASPFLDQLRTLIWKDACIDIRYERSNDEHRDYRVEPYALVVKVDTWYLIGRVQREMRVFRVSRIADAHADRRDVRARRGLRSAEVLEAAGASGSRAIRRRAISPSS